MNGNPEIIAGLSLIIVITSMAAVEFRLLKVAAAAYIGQALLLSLTFAAFAYFYSNHALYLWSVTVLITKALIIPVLLFRYIARTAVIETQPLFGLGPSVLVAGMILSGFYILIHRHVEFLAPTPFAHGEPFRTILAVSFTVMVLGLYSIMTRKDAIKAVIGLCLLENGVHLSLVSLAPTIPETTLIGVATDVIGSVWILLVIIQGIYKETGTMDTFKLSRLRW